MRLCVLLGFGIAGQAVSMSLNYWRKKMAAEIVSIVIEVDGQLSQVAIPKDRKELLLGMIASVFDDGRIQAVKLDSTWKKIPLSEVNKNE
jgi:hypothetical protein